MPNLTFEQFLRDCFSRQASATRPQQVVLNIKPEFADGRLRFYGYPIGVNGVTCDFSCSDGDVINDEDFAAREAAAIAKSEADAAKASEAEETPPTGEQSQQLAADEIAARADLEADRAELLAADTEDQKVTDPAGDSDDA